jgi:hypothetical protein
MAAGVRTRIEVVGVPFLDGMHSLPAMEAFLSQNERHRPIPPEVISLATLRKALGDVAGARRVLAATVNRPVSPRTPKERLERPPCKAAEGTGIGGLANHLQDLGQ